MSKYNSYQNKIIEIRLSSSIDYNDPFNEIELDALIENPEGQKAVIPAFWAGKKIWKFRYSSHIEGSHKFITRCSDENNSGLNNKEGEIRISKYSGNNKLLKHGFLRISRSGRFLEHIDGTPFLWLGDTWWYGLVKRLKWPKEFKKLTNDRAKKGFNIIQLVTGMYPYFTCFDEWMANEAGYPMDKEFKTVNPSYFDMADLRIKCLIEAGIAPCILASWGYYLNLVGIEGMKKFWRYIVARWSAYCVIWCIAGEVRMPYPLYPLVENPKKWAQEVKGLQKGWSEIAKYLKSIDPYHHPITAHPSPADNSYSSRDMFSDGSIFDIDMLQTGHHGTLRQNVFDFTLEKLEKSLSNTDVKPVINGEPSYEGVGSGFCCEGTQRFLFWIHMLKGAAGYTYGSAPVVFFTDKDSIYNKGDVLGSCDYTWQEGAYKFPGSYQLGLGKKFLEQFEWNKFESHPEWVEPHCSKSNPNAPYCVGIPGKVRIIYIPSFILPKQKGTSYEKIKILEIEKGVDYQSYFFNPRNGDILKKTDVIPSINGEWTIFPEGSLFTAVPNLGDWLIVLEAKR